MYLNLSISLFKISELFPFPGGKYLPPDYPQECENTILSPQTFMTLVFYNYIFYSFYVFMIISFK